jgi:hypothetical protein
MLIDIQEFGGEFPAVDADALPLVVATTALDCDLSLGTLKPFQTDRKVSDLTGDVIWSDDCCYLAFDDCNVSVAQADIGCKYVFVAGNGQPKYASYDDACAGNWCRLDWPCSMAAPGLSAVSSVNRDFTYERVSVVYTLVNKYGAESPPSFPSAAIDVNDSQLLAISGLPTADAGFCWEKVRIYASRSTYELPGQKSPKAHGFFEIAEVAFGTGSVAAQFGKPGNKCMTDNSDPLPVGAWDIAHARSGHLSALVANTLRFSERHQWTSWPEDYAMTVPGTALAHIAGPQWGYVLTDEAYLAVRLDMDCKGPRCHAAAPSNNILPLIAHRSAAMWGDLAFWATHEGLVMALGTEHRIVSRPWFDAKAWQAIRPDTLIGVVHQGHYFGKTENRCFRLALPNSLHAEHKSAGALVSLSINPTAFHVTRDGRLLFATADGIFEWSRGDDFKPYVWERRNWEAPGSVGLSTWKLDFKYGHPSKVEHYVGDTTLQTKAPATSKEPTKLPICKNTRWGVRIEGTSELSRYRLATSIKELNK